MDTRVIRSSNPELDGLKVDRYEPKSMLLARSYACNDNCGCCDVDAFLLSEQSKFPSLPLEKVTDILSQAREAGLEFLQPTGGEPLANEEDIAFFEQVFYKASELGFKFPSIITNASLGRFGRRKVMSLLKRLLYTGHAMDAPIQELEEKLFLMGYDVSYDDEHSISAGDFAEFLIGFSAMRCEVSLDNNISLRQGFLGPDRTVLTLNVGLKPGYDSQRKIKGLIRALEDGIDGIQVVYDKDLVDLKALLASAIASNPVWSKTGVYNLREDREEPQVSFERQRKGQFGKLISRLYLRFNDGDEILIKINYFPIEYLGRAKRCYQPEELCVFETYASSCYGRPGEQVLVVMPNLDVSVCCGGYCDNQYVHMGNLDRDHLTGVFARANQNLVFLLIASKSPEVFRKVVPEMPQFPHPCQACEYLLGRRKQIERNLDLRIT